MQTSGLALCMSASGCTFTSPAPRLQVGSQTTAFGNGLSAENCTAWFYLGSLHYKSSTNSKFYNRTSSCSSGCLSERKPFSELGTGLLLALQIIALLDQTTWHQPEQHLFRQSWFCEDPNLKSNKTKGTFRLSCTQSQGIIFSKSSL